MIVGGKESEDNPVRTWEEAESTAGIIGIRPANGRWATELPANPKITGVASAREEVAWIHAIEPTDGDFDGEIAVAIDPNAAGGDSNPRAEEAEGRKGSKASVTGTGGREAGASDRHLATCATTKFGSHHRNVGIHTGSSSRVCRSGAGKAHHTYNEHDRDEGTQETYPDRGKSLHR